MLVAFPFSGTSADSAASVSIARSAREQHESTFHIVDLERNDSVQLIKQKQQLKKRLQQQGHWSKT
jgi:hypothetical protein